MISSLTSSTNPELEIEMSIMRMKQTRDHVTGVLIRKRTGTYVLKIAPACLAAILMLVSSVNGGDGPYVISHASDNTHNLGPTGMTGTPIREEGKRARIRDFLVHTVEAGSPADGIVREGDVIIGLDGKIFSGSDDVSRNFGYAIIDAEAKDGLLPLLIKRGNEQLTVTIKLDRLPDYSPTWPFDCVRTDTMLINACNFLAREQTPGGFVRSDEGFIGQHHSGLLWLAMGEPRYYHHALRAVYWFADYVLMKESKGEDLIWGAWNGGYGGVLLAEYYMMTGDKAILPILKKVSDCITNGQMESGGWSHYFGKAPGYGEVNNAGMICFMALCLARECGIEVEPAAFRRAERYYDRFAPALTSDYGNYNVSFDGYATQNGKIGAMAVAHRLNGRTLDSKGYALKAARSFNSIQSGHTGHFFNILWTCTGSSLAPAEEYRKGFDQLGAYFSMARTWRGGFYCQPGKGSRTRSYALAGQLMTTGGYGLSLAFPRRHLSIHGAPESVFVASLPAELAAARDLHQANRWDEAIAAVDVFLAKRGHDPEPLRLANELRDKSRYVKDGMALALAKLEAMSSGGRTQALAYETVKWLGPMRKVLGDDDPRLKNIEGRLPGKNRKIWEQGEQFYESVTALKMIQEETWFPYAKVARRMFPAIYMPEEEPAWTPIVIGTADAKSYATHVVRDATHAPAGWAGPDFDDAGWDRPAVKAGKKKKSGAGKGYCMVRVGFALEEIPGNLRLKFIEKKPGLGAGGEVYLNGQLVFRTYSGIDSGAPELLRGTIDLLREGENILAYCTQADGLLPQLALEGVFPSKSSEAFPWTMVPGQDAEIRALVAERKPAKPYYNPEEDNRSAEELMNVFTAEPTFMPEIAAALDRYKVLAPPANEKSRYLPALLTSSAWGGRWTGLYMMHQRLISGGEKEIRQAIQLLKDPHPLVRKQAAMTVGALGEVAREAIPSLIGLVKDFEGQTWWTRDEAWMALDRMPVDEADLQDAVRAGLYDPSGIVRMTVLERSLFAKDNAVKKKAAQTYEKELIDQIFDIPHSMKSRGRSRTAAEVAVECLPQEVLLKYLARFMAGLSEAKGAPLDGCMMVLGSMGDDVQRKLVVLTGDKNENLRQNAIHTLQRKAIRSEVSPELVGMLRSKLRAIKDANDGETMEWARKLLVELDKHYDEANTRKEKE
jgi:hypothetical protein